MTIKTYEVSFAYGVINPIEKKIRIETINDITEDFIISEIEKNPKYKGQISCIFSYILVKEKVIETKSEQEEISQNDNSIPKFNW